MEIWKEHPVYPNVEISTLGNVRVDGKISVGWLNRAGYRVHSIRATLTPNKKKHVVYAHKLVLETFVGPKLVGLETRHLNGVRNDNRLENLSWGTPFENTQDKKLHGTILFGETSGQSKLTNENVIQIRSRIKAGDLIDNVAKEFGFSAGGLRSVVNGSRWKHLPGAFKRKPGPCKK